MSKSFNHLRKEYSDNFKKSKQKEAEYKSARASNKREFWDVKDEKKEY